MRRSRTRRAPQPDTAAAPEPPPFQPRDIRGLFATPPWLRDLGTTCWLAVGVVLLVVGAVALLSLTNTIVMPLIAAGVVSAVASPVMGWLERHRVPRGVAAALVLLTLLALAVGLTVVIVGGITGQHDAVSGQLNGAKGTLKGWLSDLGVSSSAVQQADKDASQAVTKAVPALLSGIGHGLKSLSSLVVFLSLTLLSLFFMLKDGPVIRLWVERHMRVPPPVAHRMDERVLQSLQGYFFGVTIVAAFNATLVLAGALVLGIPLAGTIALVTFMGAYIPYLGAWAAGAFAVLIALGGAGTDAAIGMIIIQLLANGILQQMIQPIAYGAALGIHPLAVLVVTIAGGALFGSVGLILAAPVTSAVTRIAGDLAAAAAADDDRAPAPQDAAQPAATA